VFSRLNTIHVLALTTRVLSTSRANLRRGQSLGRKTVWRHVTEGTSEIMCLKMLLKRRQGRAIANFVTCILASFH